MAPDANGPKGFFDISGPRPEVPPSRPEFAREPAAPAPDPAIRGVGFEPPRQAGGMPIPINNSPNTPTAPPIGGPMPAPSHQPQPKSHRFGGSLFGPKGAPKPPMSPLHPPKPAKSGGKLWFIILIVIVAVVGLYLASDAGAVPGGSNLPYHVFSKYKTSSSSASNTASSNTPAGFTLYKLSDAGVQFDAPTAWGTPTSQTDPGYSKRGGDNKSDGTHAYVVTFSQNKNVQLALTSGTLLSASKSDNRYFDDLRWCTGSIDKKFYLEKMAFTTTSGVDTPATTVCAQGPVSNVSQLNPTTVLMTKVKAVDGTSLGNVYVKNLYNNPNVVVMRALDTNGQNDSNITALLNTVQNL